MEVLQDRNLWGKRISADAQILSQRINTPQSNAIQPDVVKSPVRNFIQQRSTGTQTITLARDIIPRQQTRGQC